MNVSPEVLRTHIDYTNWATNRLLQQAARLSQDELTRDFGTADKSVLGTLVHIFVSDRLWLNRLKSEPYQSAAEADRTFDALQVKWPVLQEHWKVFGAGLTDESVDASVAYSDLRGNRWNQPLWQLLLHIVNHAAHHRGQISGFLRAMGHAPEPLDLVAFYRQMGPWKP